MINFFWRLVAKLLARPAIADWLIARAKLTPYQHIMSADGTEMYMDRWWLFNPYSRETHSRRTGGARGRSGSTTSCARTTTGICTITRGTPVRSSCAAGTRSSACFSQMIRYFTSC